jgi:hypothetical protein
MLDSGSSFFFIRRDVVDSIKKLGLPHVLAKTEERCLMANAQFCKVSDVVELGVKIQDFSWKFRFRMLSDCPIQCILGIDFLAKARVWIDFAARRYAFCFHPTREFDFERLDLPNGTSQQFSCSNDGMTSLVCGSVSLGSEQPAEVANLIHKFPALFSDQLGTVKGMTCHLEVTDTIPVRSRPYPCSPPRLQALREIVQDLMSKGVIQKSYSQYASPAFLVPKPSGIGSRG